MPSSRGCEDTISVIKRQFHLDGNSPSYLAVMSFHTDDMHVEQLLFVV